MEKTYILYSIHFFTFGFLQKWLPRMITMENFSWSILTTIPMTEKLPLMSYLESSMPSQQKVCRMMRTCGANLTLGFIVILSLDFIHHSEKAVENWVFRLYGLLFLQMWSVNKVGLDYLSNICYFITQFFYKAPDYLFYDYNVFATFRNFWSKDQK